MKTVARAFLRYLPRRRGLSALQLLSIACGVAAAVGMALSARAALTSFSRAVEFLKGRATHTMRRPAGPLGEEELRRIMADPAAVAFSPVVDRRLPLADGESVRLLGIDPFLDRAIRPQFGQGGPPTSRQGSFLDFLLIDRTVLVAAGLAERLGIQAGSLLETSRGAFRVLGTFPNPAGEPLILMDIGHAQELLGLRGSVDYVDLILSDPSGFEARWGTGYRILSRRQNQATLGDLLRAFRLNLEALSLLGLFVGVFLVYNTAMFAVVSRRRDAGILLSLGARRTEVAAAFLLEILVLGGFGGALGGILGYGLSRFLTGLVGRTISNLYFFLSPTPPGWSWGIVGTGALLGWGACLLGGAFPLAEVIRTDPVQALRGRVLGPRGRRRALGSAAVGLTVLAAGWALLAGSSQQVYAGFAGAFALLLGASLFTGVAVAAAGPALVLLFRWLAGLAGKVAVGNLLQNLGRTAVAVAAFMVALSMSVGLGLMIGSFRQTLVWWMGTQLTGELYVATAAAEEVPEAFYEEIRKIPGLGGVDPYRNTPVTYRGTTVYVSSVNASVLQKYARFAWLSGGDENWDPVKAGAVIVSESFLRRFGIGAGDSVTLDGVAGPVTLPVAAVFYDYTTEHGLIMMDRSTYLKIYDDRTLDSFGVFVDPGDPRAPGALAEVRRRARERGLPVVTRDELHRDILGVFDSTFAVTRSMRVLAVIVAFFGIAGALLTLHMERQREFGIYRALGFSTVQVAAMTLVEGLGMGMLSFALATGVGTLLSLVLIRAINIESFHWTIFFHPAWGPYLIAAAIAVLASLGAAAYPIWRVSVTYPQMQIREE